MDLGLDFETAGLDHRRRPPLALGLAYFKDLEVITKEFLFTEAYKTILKKGMFDAKAIEINKIDISSHPEEISYNSLDEVYNAYDFKIMKYLQSLNSSRLIPVGFNVGQFDMRYMWHYFPQSATILHYQVHELNMQIDDLGKLGFINVKNEAKSYAANKIGVKANWHDAVYDATAAIHIKVYLDDKFINVKKKLMELEDALELVPQQNR